MQSNAAVGDYPVPVRWGDLDVMNHVNNVHLVAIAEHGAVLLTSSGQWAVPPPPLGVHVRYRRPVSFSGQQLLVRNRVEGSALRQDIIDHTPGGSPVCATVTTRPDATVPDWLSSNQRSWPAAMTWLPRWSDIGPDNEVRISSLFGLVQEARIALFADLIDEVGGDFVILEVEQYLTGRLPFRPEPYGVRSGVQRIGTSSLVVLTGTAEAELAARTVVVAYDSGANTSRPLTDIERRYFSDRVIDETLRPVRT